ncbi:MAG: hypothetical protein OEW93_07750, partial [Candidatus Bathyarchaeota archaeon]|nr:hypothetical protein [Candidatus Bathyarchaeota archaeon]
VPPFYNVAFELVNSPVGVNLTEVSSALVIKLGPDFAETLAAFDLDVRIHVEGKSVEADISFDLPGYAAVNGRIDFVTDDQMSEGVLNAEMTVKIWYTVYPKEHIEMLIESFPMLKAQLLSAVSDATEGKLTVKDLVIVDSEVGPVMATITFRASVVGDFVEGLSGLPERVTIPNIDLPDIEPGIDFDEAITTSVKSADLRVSFDNEELAFSIVFEGVVEGDVDGQINLIKRLVLEESLQESELDPETVEMINSFLLPTELSVVDLNTTVEYSIEDEVQVFEFSLCGLGLRPPTAEALLIALQKASEEVSQPNFTLTLKSGSEGKRYVEIVVPEPTSEPLAKEPRRVVWAFDDIENLSQVTFEVKEQKTNIGLTPQVAVSIVGAAAAIAVVAFLLVKRM